MADKYSGNSGPSRAIYHSSHMTPYIIFLVLCKLLYSIGIYLSYDILKLLHVVQFLFLLKLCSSVILIFIQKPFSSGKRLSKNQWLRIGRHAFFGSLINVLWLFGLSLCGPLRTLLLYEHSDMVVIGAASALVTHGGSPAKFRGAVFFLLAVVSILLFDHDDVTHHGQDHQQHRNSAFLSHLFDHLTHMTGLSDHKGGVVLLFGTLGVQAGYNSAAKKLSVDLGGAKRLNALSTLMSAVLLMPWALFVFFTRESTIESWLWLAPAIILVATFLFVLDYYVESVAASRLEQFRSNRYGAMAVFVGGLLLSCVWNHPFVGSITAAAHLRDVLAAEDHVLSGGVIFSLVLLLFATHVLTSPVKGSKGNMVGYSSGGLPLYSFTGDAIHRTSHSIFLIIKNGLRQILDESDSRKIFYFLCVNLSFTFVELLYGVWTNSLGLISDGFHMLFDCWALVMGLYAAVMARWKATRIFSYGYDRIEILSGFTNGLFLMVIAFFVFMAALTRIVDPPEIHTERLLAVSVLGLAVNLIGIFAFRHGHTHGGGGHGHSHGGGGHGHSHGGGGHGHAHGGAGGAAAAGGGGHGHLTDNANMEGVFLHVLADTLGSVGVIISTLFIENFGWKIADPICSLFIAALIFLSVMPLVKETGLILLLRTPLEQQNQLGEALQKILAVEGILSYRGEHFWRHSSKVVCGTIHIQTTPDASEQKIIAQVTGILKDFGVQNLTVQVEKQAYYQHMSGLGFSIEDVLERTNSIKALDYNTNAATFIKAI